MVIGCGLSWRTSASRSCHWSIRQDIQYSSPGRAVLRQFFVAHLCDMPHLAGSCHKRVPGIPTWSAVDFFQVAKEQQNGINQLASLFHFAPSSWSAIHQGIEPGTQGYEPDRAGCLFLRSSCAIPCSRQPSVQAL